MDPIGNVRPSLLRPLANSACDDANCTSSFKAIDELPYCIGYRATSNDANAAIQQQPCAYFDENDVGIIEPTSIMIVTKLTTSNQQRTCFVPPLTNEACTTLFNQTDVVSNYVADIEDYTIMLTHYAQSTSPVDQGKVITVTDYENQGSLYVPDNHNLCASMASRATGTSAPCYITPLKTLGAYPRDYFPVRTLLAAGNIDLDSLVRGRSIRDGGLSATIQIEYSNWHLWKGLDTPSYTYT